MSDKHHSKSTSLINLKIEQLTLNNSFNIPQENQTCISTASSSRRTSFFQRISSSSNNKLKIQKPFRKIQKNVLEKRQFSDNKHVSFKSDFEDVVAIKSWKKYNINNNVYKIKLNSKSEEIKCGCVVF